LISSLISSFAEAFGEPAGEYIARLVKRLACPRGYTFALAVIAWRSNISPALMHHLAFIVKAS
jgi:hypothetical protein